VLIELEFADHGTLNCGRPTGSVGSQTDAARRRDSVVGYADAAELLERYPHTTLAVIEDAGHAVMRERPDLLAALFGDWLIEPDQKASDRPS